MDNHLVSRAFSLYSELLQLHGQGERLSDWLAGAAYRIRQMEKRVTDMSEDEMAEQFRPEIIEIIKEGKKRHNIAALEGLIQLTPSGLFDMMRIKGLGGRKLHVLWQTAKIDTIEGLLSAAKAGELRSIPGFGAKTEANIIEAIEAMNSSAEHFHYATVADLADEFVAALKKRFDTELISLCGDIRRQTTTVERIEVLAGVVLSRDRLKKLMNVSEQTEAETTGHTHDEILVAIYHTTPSDFYRELFLRTGTSAHTQRVLTATANFSSEEAIYQQARLPFIVPELREDMAEWDWAKDPQPLITLEDIRGVVHNHTDWSDGVDRLESFAKACQRKCYEYVVISDHSQNAHYAGGLKPDKVLRQLEAIDQLNKKVGPFKIFKSIECDILVSGELDYDPALLSQFDLVIISVHQQLKMAEEKATARLIKAIENPFTTILGHMTGRQLLVRPGYPLDFKKVIDACATNGVVIELNANPYRLDMDWSHIPYALEKGVMISIDPDSHSIHEIDNIRWGVSAARKGGLTKAMTWNAQPLAFIEDWLAKRNTKRNYEKEKL
ncbi:DNA polymerase/3'-5' exonuclease PolX [Mucilaginibacter sp. SG564]|uniref:DNA polymerase/3'-5' exonuclease PolX n=1 Tax=Mucilaginibacter sp. SG564 TaxID=2587022 RepID=UPI001553B961|nr:DNA polymerase/3'-5' exonuclease PolX [Mucilaginibacter sp. SG564]NOW96105.1 DNA polymerase (family 10) [Mucilaginibacter sp. SG564]